MEIFYMSLRVKFYVKSGGLRWSLKPAHSQPNATKPPARQLSAERWPQPECGVAWSRIASFKEMLNA